MRERVKKYVLTGIKIAIAVVGLWWVISHTPWHDVATLRKGQEIYARTLLEPVEVTVMEREKTGAGTSPAGGIKVHYPDKAVKQRDANGREIVEPIRRANTGAQEDIIGKERLESVADSGEPRIQVGLKNLIKGANLGLLAASWALLVIPLLISGIRWKKLLEPQGVNMATSKCLQLTFVGQFYSTFLPGTTSGDLVKIFYTSRLIGSKTKAAVTVMLDRVIGLIALVVIAGVAACFQLDNPTMQRIALLVGAILGGLAVGSLFYFSRRLRRATGLAWLLDRPFVPEFVRHTDEVLHAYRGHPGVLVFAFAISLVTQVVVPLSAWLAGRAFGINDASVGHYLAYVPLANLAAALPISFLGLGVMDSVLFNFFYLKKLATASQTFALAQAVRFFPVLWNLVGAWWVATGTYSRKQAVKEEAAAAGR